MKPDKKVRLWKISSVVCPECCETIQLVHDGLLASCEHRCWTHMATRWRLKLTAAAWCKLFMKRWCWWSQIKDTVFDFHSVGTLEDLQHGCLFIMCGFINPLSVLMLQMVVLITLIWQKKDDENTNKESSYGSNFSGDFYELTFSLSFSLCWYAFFYSNYYEIKCVFMLFLTINMAIMKLFTSMTCCCSSLSNYLTFLSIWLFSSYFLASTGQQITPIFRERCLRQRVDSSPSSSPHFLQLFRTVPLQNRHPMTAAGAIWGPAFKLIWGY